MRTQRIPLTLGALAMLCGSLALVATASAGVVVHTPEEILADWTRSVDGVLVFTDVEGRSWEFVTTTDDPEIANPGTGTFHPVNPTVVRQAVQAVDYPLESCSIEIFLLPYPRRGLLKSSAQGTAIYLSPGTAPTADLQVHSVAVHEIAHVVHNQLMDSGLWARYRQVRGITDSRFSDSAPLHKDRPREIFAEDFRYLFGGADANYAGTIENPDIALPDLVPGLEDFFRALAGSGHVGHDLTRRGRLELSPNPTVSGVQVSWASDAGLSGAHPVDVRVFDVRGRLVSEETGVSPEFVRWDGSGPSGTHVGPGLYFLELRQGAQSWVGKVVVAR